MNPLPLNLPGVFDQQFKRGIVIYTDYLCHDGTLQPKLLIPVSLDCEAGTVYCLRCTSKLDRYQFEPFASQAFLVDPSCPVFDEPTAIIFASPEPYEREDLKARFVDERFRFIDTLPEDLMSEIDTKMGSCRLISPRLKGLILPDWPY